MTLIVDSFLVIVGLISLWEDLLPDIGDLCGSHLLVLHLNHGEAAHGVQQAAGAHQVDGAPLLGELREGFPPAETRQTSVGSGPSHCWYTPVSALFNGRGLA